MCFNMNVFVYKGKIHHITDHLKQMGKSYLNENGELEMCLKEKEDLLCYREADTQT